MKAKLIDRILLAILLIIVIVFSLCLILLACRVYPADSISSVIQEVYSSTTVAIIVGACGLVLLIIAIRLMFAGTKRKEPQPTSTLIKSTELGSTFITLSAIDSMVQKHCRNNNRIRSTVSNIRALRDGGIGISVRLALMPDTDIPALTGELQKSLKEYVEGLAGITVREVGVLVEDTSINPKARVD